MTQIEYYSERRGKTLVDVTVARPQDLMSLSETHHPDLYEQISISSVLKEFTLEQLERLFAEKAVYLHISRKSKTENEKKELMIAHIEAEMLNVGLKNFTRFLTKELMLVVTDRVPYEFLTKNYRQEEEDRKKIPKNVMQKRFAEHLGEVGFNAYMKKLEVSVLKSMIANLGYTPIDANKRTPLAEQITEILHVETLRSYFDTVSTSLLNDVMKNMGVWSTSPSKQKIIDCIIFGTCYTPEERGTQETSSYEKKPKKISERLTKVDLLTWYLASELRDFCKDNGLLTSGKKNALAQRIVDFYDPEKENEVPGKKGKRSRKGKKQAENANADEESFSGSAEVQLKERKSNKRVPETKKGGLTYQEKNEPEVVEKKKSKKSKTKETTEQSNRSKTKETNEQKKTKTKESNEKKRPSGRKSVAVQASSSSEDSDIEPAVPELNKKMSKLSLNLDEDSSSFSFEM